jgi:hypothetical protein
MSAGIQRSWDLAWPTSSALGDVPAARPPAGGFDGRATSVAVTVAARSGRDDVVPQRRQPRIDSSLSMASLARMLYRFAGAVRRAASALDERKSPPGTRRARAFAWIRAFVGSAHTRPIRTSSERRRGTKGSRALSVAERQRRDLTVATGWCGPWLANVAGGDRPISRGSPAPPGVLRGSRSSATRSNSTAPRTAEESREAPRCICLAGLWSGCRGFESRRSPRKIASQSRERSLRRHRRPPQAGSAGAVAETSAPRGCELAASPGTRRARRRSP